jgi:hypothetical protein
VKYLPFYTNGLVLLAYSKVFWICLSD